VEADRETLGSCLGFEVVAISDITGIVFGLCIEIFLYDMVIVVRCELSNKSVA
jgi:hypothetical protein